MRWQSTWPSKGHLQRDALDTPRKVNDRTVAILKIDVSPGRRRGAGVTVARTQIPRACSTAATGVDGLPLRAKQTPRWRCGDPFPACDGRKMMLAWHKKTRRRQNSWLEKDLWLDRRQRGLVPYGPMADPAARWSRKPVTKAEDMQGLKYRPPPRIYIDVFTGHGSCGQPRCRGGELVRRWIAVCSMRPSSKQ